MWLMAAAPGACGAVRAGRRPGPGKAAGMPRARFPSLRKAITDAGIFVIPSVRFCTMPAVVIYKSHGNHQQSPRGSLSRGESTAPWSHSSPCVGLMLSELPSVTRTGT